MKHKQVSSNGNLMERDWTDSGTSSWSQYGTFISTSISVAVESTRPTIPAASASLPWQLVVCSTSHIPQTGVDDGQRRQANHPHSYGSAGWIPEDAFPESQVRALQVGGSAVAA